MCGNYPVDIPNARGSIVCDRPAPKVTDEIEVTPEMLSAASEVLEKYYLGDGIYDVRGPCLGDIFRAMDESRRKSHSPDRRICSALR